MTFKITVAGITDNQPIPDRYALCAPDGHLSRNVSPAISWSGAPEGTRAFAIFVVDRDAVLDRTDVNIISRSVAEDAQRRDFYHWLLVDIPADISRIEEGDDAGGIKGQNDFGARAKGMNGYDGPCPPWNDERWHHYGFKVCALDVPSLRLEQGYMPEDALAAMAGHVLAEAEVVGTYTTNVRLVRSHATV